MLINIITLLIFGWSVFRIYNSFRNILRINEDIKELKPVLTFRNMFYFLGLYSSMTIASLKLGLPAIERLAAYGTIGILILLVILDFMLAKKSNFKYFS